MKATGIRMESTRRNGKGKKDSNGGKIKRRTQTTNSVKESKNSKERKE